MQVSNCFISPYHGFICVVFGIWIELIESFIWPSVIRLPRNLHPCFGVKPGCYWCNEIDNFFPPPMNAASLKGLILLKPLQLTLEKCCRASSCRIQTEFAWNSENRWGIKRVWLVPFSVFLITWRDFFVLPCFELGHLGTRNGNNSRDSLPNNVWGVASFFQGKLAVLKLPQLVWIGVLEQAIRILEKRLRVWFTLCLPTAGWVSAPCPKWENALLRYFLLLRLKRGQDCPCFSPNGRIRGTVPL